MNFTHLKLKPEESVDYNIKLAWHAISRLYNMGGNKYGITASTGFILLNIDSEEGTPATKIAPQFGLEARSITRTLKSMEDAGLIYRKQGDTDKRFVRIFLTEKGKEKKEIVRRVVKQFNVVMYENIDIEKLKVFFEVIQKVYQIVDEQSKLAKNDTL
ncbi:MAG: MarR family transcriptional regulator [Thermonemataceae bacterium]|nr:MarR family transcriptional regulator [Thermonemataceae bacterium]